MFVFFNEYGFVSSLEHMTDSVVPAIEAPCQREDKDLSMFIMQGIVPGALPLYCCAPTNASAASSTRTTPYPSHNRKMIPNFTDVVRELYNFCYAFFSGRVA